MYTAAAALHFWDQRWLWWCCWAVHSFATTELWPQRADSSTNSPFTKGWGRGGRNPCGVLWMSSRSNSSVVWNKFVVCLQWVIPIAAYWAQCKLKCPLLLCFLLLSPALLLFSAHIFIFACTSSLTTFFELPEQFQLNFWKSRNISKVVQMSVERLKGQNKSNLSRVLIHFRWKNSQ